MSHLRPSTGHGAASGRASSAASRKSAGPVAHTSLKHAIFNAPPVEIVTHTLTDPFTVYQTKLTALEQQVAKGTIASHHLVIDSVRILEDILIHAGQTFLEHRQPPELLSLTSEYAAQGISERLRDAEVISPWTNRQIEEARKLAKWVLVSSAREVPWETSQNLLILVSKLCAAFVADVEHAAANKCKNGCSANHAFCRDMMPQHLDVVGGPHNAETIPTNTRPDTASSPTIEGAASPTSPTASAPVVPTLPTVGGLANPESKKLQPRPRAHAALPYGWTVQEFEEHCKPLHNTTHLDLQALEDEEEEAEREANEKLQAEHFEKVRLKEEAAERRRERREAEERARAERAGLSGPDGDLSDLDENPDEVDSEEERLTARRREARAAAGEGASEPIESSEEEESEEEDEDEDDEAAAERRAARAEKKAAKAERKAQEAEDEKMANETITVVQAKPTRFAFTFCCIVCHSIIARARDLDRIVANQVWTKPGKNLNGKSLLKNFADTWYSRPADDVTKSSTGGEEDEEEEESPAGDEDDENVNPDVPKDDGAAKREESIGVHCAGCDYYLGRYFVAKDAYRLIYIHRSTGQNFMYFTGSASPERLRPAMRRLTEEEEEAEAEKQAQEEEQGSEEEEEEYLARLSKAKEAKAKQPIPPIIGLPIEYEDVRQAELYPFPRFGSSTPYNRPSSWTVFHTMLTDVDKAQQLLQASLPSGGKFEESKMNETSKVPLSMTGLIATRPPGSKGTGGSTAQNSKTYKPLIPSLPKIHTMLRRNPDSHYELAPLEADGKSGSPQITADLSVLLWTDRIFHNRRAMDALTTRVISLWTHFPSGIYANTTNPVIPLFTYFFVKNEPDFTMCRGTARYLFHFLTKKDDSKVKRQVYTYKKFVKSLSKYENSVYHLTAGGYGGHRFVLVKIGSAYRIFQSNNCLESVTDRFSCLQWLASDYPWSRVLDSGELYAFLAKFEEARRGRKQIWEELFTCGQKALGLYDISDQWQPDQVFFAQAKLQDFAIQI